MYLGYFPSTKKPAPYLEPEIYREMSVSNFDYLGQDINSTYSNFNSPFLMSKDKRDYLKSAYTMAMANIQKATGIVPNITFSKWLNSAGGELAIKKYDTEVKPAIEKQPGKGLVGYLNSPSGVASLNKITEVTGIITGQKPVYGNENLPQDDGSMDAGKTKKILGMTPVTFIIVAASVLVVGAASVVIYVKTRKK